MDIGLPEAGIQQGLNSMSVGQTARVQSGIHLIASKPPTLMPDISEPHKPTDPHVYDSDDIIIYLEERLAILKLEIAEDTNTLLIRHLISTEQVLLTKIAELQTTLDNAANNVWYKRLYRWMLNVLRIE